MKIPYIENNAFFNNKAINLLDPSLGKFNDHCFVFSENKWHFLTYQGQHGIGGKSIINKFNIVNKFPNLQPYIKKYELWAPCSITHSGMIYVFFAMPRKKWKKNWKKFADYVEIGGLFTMVLAQAPVNKLGQLKITNELFDDDGGARDPFVFFHEVSKQWIMLYAKRIYNNNSAIESGIAYRVSKDLIHWSEQKGYVIRNFFYDDEIKDQVTVTLGNGESPQLVKYNSLYYLFVTQVGNRQYHRTKVWVSENPLAFSKSDKPITTLYAHAPEIIKQNNEWFISNCGEHHKEFGETGIGLRVPGIEIAQLLWK